MELKNRSFKEAMETIMPIPAKIKELEKRRNSIFGEYVGDRLRLEQQKISDVIAELEQARQNAIDGLRKKLIDGLNTTRDAAIKAGKEASLDGAALTHDYKLLALPVTLTGEEMQTLADRHWADPLFMRTLTAYEKKHQPPTPVDFTDPLNRAADIIHRTLNTVSFHAAKKGADYFLPDNPHLIAQWDAEITAALESICEETAT